MPRWQYQALVEPVLPQPPPAPPAVALDWLVQRPEVVRAPVAAILLLGGLCAPVLPLPAPLPAPVSAWYVQQPVPVRASAPVQAGLYVQPLGRDAWPVPLTWYVQQPAAPIPLPRPAELVNVQPLGREAWRVVFGWYTHPRGPVWVPLLAPPAGSVAPLGQIAVVVPPPAAASVAPRGTIQGLSLPANSATWPPREARVIVQSKRTWGEPWQAEPALRARSAQVHTLSVGHGQAQLEWRYGELFEAGVDRDYATVLTRIFTRAWVRLLLAPPPPPDDDQIDPSIEPDPHPTLPGDAAPVPIFQGYIVKDGDAPDNTAETQTSRGNDTLICAGPERLLDQMVMNEAIWEVDSVLVRLGRLTSFNALTDSGRVRGNRSFTKRNGCYHFGGSSLWTHRDVLEYLVVELLNQGNQAPTNSRPFWTISGQPEILNDMTLPIACGEVMTARRLLDAILAPCFGRDAVILPTELGYELSVFSLLTETIVAGGYTLPENPYQYDISLTAAYDVVARFEWCTAQLFDRIVVQGAPIVIVLSFGAGAPGGNNCRAGWSAALETAYQAAAGADPDINDDFRTSDKFRDVYQLFLVTGAWQSTPRQWVMCALDGTLVTTNAPYQRQLRRSRPELPLRAGYDYTTSPPTWVGDPDVIPEELPPLAWVLCSDTGRYVLVDLLHIADKRPAVVHALRDDWGIRLRSAPNHAYALNHWTGANQTNFIPDGSSAVDYAGLGFTIAIESDHRVRVGADLPAGEQFGCGLVQVIEVPDALLHVLAPQTVVGTSATGALAKSPDALVVLRDDRETLKATLAGAIGRYERWRCRASLNYAQLNAGSLSLGAVLRSVDIGGLTRNVAAVLSSCVWDFDARRTMLSAGQAER